MIRSLRKRSKTADDKDKANCSMTRKVIDRRMIREWIGTEQPKISHESFCLLPYRVQYRTLIPKVVVSLFALHWSTLVAIFLWISQGMPSPLSSTTSSVDDENEKDGAAEAWLQSMDWNGWVGQMAQIDVNMLLNDDKTALRQDLLDHYIGTLGVGSVLNNVVNPPQIWTIRDFRKAVIQIQETAKKFRRPPVIWGLDSVHGANYLHNTITTPQPFNLASSFNETLLYQAGRWASVDTRRAGIPWLFSPLLGLSWNPFWSRTYETFGEDPVLVGAMARAMTRGIQDTDPTDSNIIPSRAAACAKHWVGYSFPHNGHDRAPSWIPKRHLYQYFLLPWKQVLDETLTVMESYTEMDGVPNVANRQTLDRLLRRELQFDGMLVTDYHEIFNLAEWHHTAKDRNEALQKVMVEGTVDMSMIANEPDDFFAAMHNLVNTTGMKSRMESSARRVLQLKQKLNMFQESFNLTVNDTDDDGPSAEALQAALEMTHQSIVLAQNSNDALPLNPKEPLRVLVTGPTSRSLSFQTGGWTGQWQGVDSRKEDKWFTYGSTVWDAISQRSSSSEDGYEWQVTYECGVDILGHDCQDPGILAFVEDSNEEEPEGGGGVMGTIKGWVGWNGDEAPMYEEPMFSIERAMNQATSSDVIVVCVGEENYTEKPGDIRRLQLPSGQYELVAGLREVAPNAKIILLYFGGRPRLLQEIVDGVDAVVLGFLPGPLAGDAMVDILTGRVNPSARLPITYPKYEDGGGIPYLHAVSDMCTDDADGGTLPHWVNAPCEVQWPFGHGLSYTQFEYDNLKLNTQTLQYHHCQKEEKGDDSSSLTITVTVKNTGVVAGAESVLFFTFDEARSSTPEYKRLRGFKKVWLEAGTSTQVHLTIPLDDFRFVGPHDDAHYVFQDKLSFRVGIGADTDCRTNIDDPRCSSPVTIRTDPDYVGACEAACNLWSESGCSQHLEFSMENCWDICSSIHQNVEIDNDLEMNNDGWGWNYVDCMESMVWGNSFNHDNDCWKLTTFCRDVLATPLMDEFGHGVTPDAFTNSANLGLIFSVISGVLASIMVFCAMRGGCSKKQQEDYGDVQFSEVRTHELM